MKDGAIAELEKNLSQIRDRLAAIEKYTDNHMGLSPEEVNWSSVAVSAKILSELNELSDFLMIPHN